MMSKLKEKILLVGAYERDNFGDLLFAIITKRFLINRGYEVSLSSFVFSDMTEVFGEYIYSYDVLLEADTWDAIWVVGGEVGNARISDALRLVMDESWVQHYNKIDNELAAEISRLIGTPRVARYAYIPKRSGYPNNKATPLVLNSVGGFSDTGVYEDETFEEVNSIVASVRNIRSQNILRERGIVEPLLSPDLVHVVADIYPKKAKLKNAPYMLVQANKDTINKTTLANFAKEIEKVSRKTSMDVVLFAAGVAPGHDDPGQYRELLSILKKTNIRQKVRLHDGRNPIELVELIANSSLWVGSSLHGRIIACSYGIPRISFSKVKLNDYAELWDPGMPYGVDPSEFSRAVDQALAVEDDMVGRNLAAMSMNNFNETLGRLNALKMASKRNNRKFDAKSPISFQQLVIRNEKSATNLVAGVASKQEDLENQRKLISELRAEIETLKTYRFAYEDITGSISYRSGRMMSAPFRPLKRIYQISRHKLGLIKNRRKLLRDLDTIYETSQNNKGQIRVDLVIRSYEYPTSSTFIRLVSPLSSGALKGKVRYRFVNGETLGISSKADVVIIQRTAIAHLDDAKALVAKIKHNNTKLYVDTDDAFSMLDTNHPQYLLQKERVEALDYVIQNADEVWFSTEKLKATYDIPNGKVVRNTIDSRIWTRLREGRVVIPEKGGPLHILYMGTKTHDKDFQLIEPALRRLHEHYPGEFIFHIIGVASENRQYPWLVEHQPSDSLYPYFIRWFNELPAIDIGISPLEDNAFNESKSDIKCLDYLGLGVKPIVSDVGAYKNPELDPYIVRVKNTTDAWYNALENELVSRDKSRSLAEERIRSGYDYVRKYRLPDRAAKQIAKSFDIESAE